MAVTCTLGCTSCGGVLVVLGRRRYHQVMVSLVLRAQHCSVHSIGRSGLIRVRPSPASTHNTTTVATTLGLGLCLWPVGRSTNQPINQSINQPINQSINQRIEPRPLALPVGRSINQSSDAGTYVDDGGGGDAREVDLALERRLRRGAVHAAHREAVVAARGEGQLAGQRQGWRRLPHAEDRVVQPRLAWLRGWGGGGGC